MIVKRRRQILGETFEAWLIGDDHDRLCSAGDAALAEAVRVAELLTGDPVAHINREAAAKTLIVEHELFGVLSDCLRWYGETFGHFDPLQSRDGSERTFVADVQLDAQHRHVRLRSPQVAIDLTAYAHGYALDAAACVLEELQLDDAVLKAGNTGMLARGQSEGETAWSVPLPNPFGNAPDGPVRMLHDESFAVVRKGDVASLVVAPSSVEAEVYAAAFSRLDREAAEKFARQWRLWHCAVARFERSGQDVACEWLKS